MYYRDGHWQGGGEQRPTLRVIEPKNTRARSARAQGAGRTHQYYHICR
jgi:hypothetical protein